MIRGCSIYNFNDIINSYLAWDYKKVHAFEKTLSQELLHEVRELVVVCSSDIHFISDIYFQPMLNKTSKAVLPQSLYLSEGFFISRNSTVDDLA